MKTRVASTVILSCLASDLLVMSAFAAFGTVDQEYHAVTYPNSQASFVAASNRGVAQTFTVGRSGILSAVEVGLIRLEDTESVLIADIRRVVSNVPDFSDNGILATRTMSSRILPIESYPGIYISRFTLAVDFLGDNLRVEVGDKLALHLHSNGDFDDPGTSNQFPLWWVDAPTDAGALYDGYLGGDLYASMSPTLVVPPLPPGIYPFHGDSQFRTYVQVPESVSALVMLAGAAGLFGFNRSRSALQ